MSGEHHALAMLTGEYDQRHQAQLEVVVAERFNELEDRYRSWYGRVVSDFQDRTANVSNAGNLYLGRNKTHMTGDLIERFKRDLAESLRVLHNHQQDQVLRLLEAFHAEAENLSKQEIDRAARDLQRIWQLKKDDAVRLIETDLIEQKVAPGRRCSWPDQ